MEFVPASTAAMLRRNGRKRATKTNRPPKSPANPKADDLAEDGGNDRGSDQRPNDVSHEEPLSDPDPSLSHSQTRAMAHQELMARIPAFPPRERNGQPQPSRLSLQQRRTPSAPAWL
jgi:hypothetical protein